MDAEANPAKVLFTESQRLGSFVHFWRRRIEIETTYFDNLSGLQIPGQPVNGQLQELAHKTHELLIDEIEERRRGLDKLQAAYKTLSNEFRTEEGTEYFDQWGTRVKMSLRRTHSLAAEVATAESSAERLAVKEREENSSKKKESQRRPNVFSRLRTTGNAQPHDTSSFLSADSAYRQKVQQLNDQKYIIQNEIIPQTEHHAEHDRKCIVALRYIVSTFSAVQSDLAQVLNVTSSQLCNVSSSVDASVESASFAERLDESFTSLIQPYRYTSYELSSSLRLTTMIFGYPLPDALDGASIGQRAVLNAFKTILSSAAEKNMQSLYKAMCDGHKQQRDDIKLSALQLESLWDSSQRNGGPGAVDYLAKASSICLLVYFFTRLPTPFLPLQDAEIKSLEKLPGRRSEANFDPKPGVVLLAKAGNRMGTARRCHLARLICAFQSTWLVANALWPEGMQILTRTPLFLTPAILDNFVAAVWYIRFTTNKSSENSMLLPEDYIKELRRDGLFGDEKWERA